MFFYIIFATENSTNLFYNIKIYNYLKMKTVNNAFFIIVLLSVCSCSSTNIVTISAKSDNSKILALDAVFEQKEFHISDLVDTLEVIALETTSESVLASINLTKITDDYIYVMDSYQNGGLAIFDKDGKFVHRLLYGNGPGEINSVTSFDVDEHFLYTYQPDKVNKYTLNGIFIESYPILEKLKMFFNSIHIVNDGFLLSIMPCNSEYLVHSVLYVDSDFNQKQLFLFDNHFDGFISFDNFKMFKEGVVFAPVMHNTVYKFDGATFKPFYYFDYSKHENTFETNPDCNSSGLNFRNDHCKINKFFFDGRIFETNDYLYMTFYDGYTPFRVYIDAKNGKFRSGIAPSPDDAPVWPLVYGLVVSQYDDFFVQTLPPDHYLGDDHLEENVSILEHISDEDKHKLLTAKEDDNPLIILYRLNSIQGDTTQETP